MTILRFVKQIVPAIRLRDKIIDLHSSPDLPDRKFKYPTGLFLFSLMRLVTYLTLGCIASLFLLEDSVGSKLSRFGSTEQYVIFFMGLVMTAISHILSWFRYKGMYHFLRDSVSTYKIMETVGITFHHDDRMIRTYVFDTFAESIMTMVIVTINLILQTMNNHPLQLKIILALVMNYGLLQNLLIASTFANMLRLTDGKFKQLNNLLRSSITSTLEFPQHQNVLKWNGSNKRLSANHIGRFLETDRKTMLTVRRSHQNLVVVCHEVGHMFGLQFVILGTSCFGALTMTLLYAYLTIADYIATGNRKFFQIDITGAFIWFVYFAQQMCAFTFACYNTSQEASRTGDILCELYDEPTVTEQVRAEIRDFNLQLIKNPLRFTAFGFFDIDRSLIYGVAGSIITYVVILIQLRNT